MIDDDVKTIKDTWRKLPYRVLSKLTRSGRVIVRLSTPKDEWEGAYINGQFSPVKMVSFELRPDGSATGRIMGSPFNVPVQL